jgi:hypothetical protein
MMGNTIICIRVCTSGLPRVSAMLFFPSKCFYTGSTVFDFCGLISWILFSFPGMFSRNKKKLVFANYWRYLHTEPSVRRYLSFNTTYNSNNRGVIVFNFPVTQTECWSDPNNCDRVRILGNKNRHTAYNRVLVGFLVNTLSTRQA